MYKHMLLRVKHRILLTKMTKRVSACSKKKDKTTECGEKHHSIHELDFFVNTQIETGATPSSKNENKVRNGKYDNLDRWNRSTNERLNVIWMKLAQIRLREDKLPKGFKTKLGLEKRPLSQLKVNVS